jgi:osmotically-inducible protein OsmY
MKMLHATPPTGSPNPFHFSKAKNKAESMKIIMLKEWPHRAGIGRRSALLLIAAGMQIVFVPWLQAATTEQPATTQQKITDRGITNAVEDGLIYEKGVYPDYLDVSTSQGIVTLSGSGDNILFKERAVKIAESIRGVRGVIDQTTVTPVSRPDEDIRKDILTALLQDPATESYQVAVSVQDAVATLTGTVGSYAEKQLAAMIAKGVKGIKAVNIDVTINYLEKRTDPEIAADVRDRLQWDIWLNGDLINAFVKDGNVKVSGTVGSMISESRALDDAWVNGVISVDGSGIKIDPLVSFEARRRLKYAIKSDSEIKKAVQDSLRLDPRVSAFSPDVTVDDGVVFLDGIVANLKAKTSAEQDAKNIVSVWQVNNYLKVRPKVQPTDAEMTTQLKAALLRDPLLDGSTIDGPVINRVVYLSGAVDSSLQKIEAQAVAGGIKGVALVRNHLKDEPVNSFTDYTSPYATYPYLVYYGELPYDLSEVSEPQPHLSDEQIKKNIKDRFFWSPFVDSDDIKVTVNGGVATLTGTVGTSIGWGETEKDAHRSGASYVLNRVTVKKGAWWW